MTYSSVLGGKNESTRKYNYVACWLLSQSFFNLFLNHIDLYFILVKLAGK